MKEPRWNPFVALGKLLFALVLIGVVLAFMAGAVLWGIIKAIWPFLVVAGVVGAIMFLVDVDRGKKQRMMAEQAARQAAWEAEQARLAALPKPPAPGVPPTGQSEGRWTVDYWPPLAQSTPMRPLPVADGSVAAPVVMPPTGSPSH